MTSEMDAGVNPNRSVSIAIVMPNYNHARYIDNALGALARQTRMPDEIIIIDDASTDESVAVIEGWTKRLPQLRLLRNSQNSGVNRSTNRGVEVAISSYVACTAADDWLEPRFVERMAEAVGRYPDAPICISEYVRFDEARREIVRFSDRSEESCWYASEGMSFISGAKLLLLLGRRTVWIALSASIVKRESYLEAGGLDPDLNWHADWFLVYALAIRGGFAVVPEPLAVFRIASGSFSSVGMNNWRRQVGTCRAIYEKLRRPEFRDIYRAIAARPAPLSPFLRPMLAVIIGKARDWPFAFDVSKWWLLEVLKGQRPGPLKRLIQGSMGEQRRKWEPAKSA